MILRTIDDAHGTNQGTVCKMWIKKIKQTQKLLVTSFEHLSHYRKPPALMMCCLQRPGETKDFICCSIIRSFWLLDALQTEREIHERELIWPMEGVKLPGWGWQNYCLYNPPHEIQATSTPTVSSLHNINIPGHVGALNSSSTNGY